MEIILVPVNYRNNIFSKSFLELTKPPENGTRGPKMLLLVFLVFSVATSVLTQTLPSEREKIAEAVALTNLGFGYSKSGQYAHAVRALERAIQLAPQLAESHYFLGATYNNIGLYREAIEAFQEAIRLKPQWPEPYSGLGVAFNCSQQFDESVEALRQAIRLAPNWAQPYVNLSVTYTNQRRFQEAVAESQQANRLKPNLAEAYYRLGVAYGHLGKRGEALENFKRAIFLRPDYAEAHMDLGVTYLLLGKRVAALEQYQKVKTLNPTLASELFNAIYKDKILTASSCMNSTFSSQNADNMSRKSEFNNWLSFESPRIHGELPHHIQTLGGRS